jgi:mono/diheme cytochrome c family protein
MSEQARDDTDDRRTRPGPSHELDAYEHRTDDQPDVQKIHGPIYREKSEPRDGYQPIPMWLLLPTFALLMWGGWYLGEFSADFRADRYDGPSAFATSAGDIAQSSPPQLDPMVVGKRVYNSCAACHQANGEGVAGRFPPLADSEWVTGDLRILSRILLQGMEGPMTVRGNRYEGLMPAWPNLSDRDIAAVLTYIRGSWNNDASEVPPELVADVRAAVGNRTSPWTEPELREVEEAQPKLDMTDYSRTAMDGDTDEGGNAPPAEVPR